MNRPVRMHARLASLGVMIALAASARIALGEDAPAHVYTLEEAVGEALARHPRLRVLRADEEAADARVEEARTGKLPDVGVAAELNRSTGNTVPGAFFPTQGFPPIAGPLRGKTFDEGVWQTGVSLWATWDVLSITKQAAAIDVALASRGEASALTQARRLEVAYRAADAFLLLVQAKEATRAARASIERAETLERIVKPLVEQTLRPGVDLTRAHAELAVAQTQLARSEQAVDVRKAQLSEAVGVPGSNVDASLAASPAAVSAPIHVRGEVAKHPEVIASESAVVRADEQRKAVRVEYLPRLDLVAALWMRGSGLSGSPGAGLVPDTPNWGIGATVTWNFLDIPTIRARARSAEASHTAAVARRDEASLAVAGQLASAAAVLNGAVRVSKQAPAALSAARAAAEQAAARYKTGLISLADVADAQRQLAQAEIDDAVANLDIRRAQLLVARASGDLGPFLSQPRAGER